MLVIHRCMAKAGVYDAGGGQPALSWLRIRRGILQVTDTALVMGDLTIRYEKIDEALLLSTRKWFIPGYVLRVRCGSTIHDFCVNWGRFWQGELPFPVRRMKAKVRWTWSALALRAALAAAVLYWLWARFGR
ncbi:MAG: hypothetical protein HY812_16985 [Planctomycetes bacterium]|nr:hypothetical protein [Planctomycetota bacterium]